MFINSSSNKVTFHKHFLSFSQTFHSQYNPQLRSQEGTAPLKILRVNTVMTESGQLSSRFFSTIVPTYRINNRSQTISGIGLTRLHFYYLNDLNRTLRCLMLNLKH